MQNLHSLLTNSDTGLLTALAQTWGVNTSNLEHLEIVNQIAAAMLDSDKSLKIWDKLTDAERGAVQLISASGRKMALPQFERVYGKIRKMGRAQIERDLPHRNPATVAEGLFYRGIIGEGFEQSKTGMRPIVFIPDDLAAALPLHKTSYSNIKVEPGDIVQPQKRTLYPIDEEEIEEAQHADTSIVDDMTTLLAYLRIHSAGIEGVTFIAADIEKILPHLLVNDAARLGFMLAVGVSAGLIDVQDGRAHAGKTRLQPWLSAQRGTQLKELADAWKASTVYAEIWHIAGLYPEDGWTYNAALAREALAAFLKQYPPANGWWSLDEFIELVKAVEPDFQRPGGDYDSWYIRNDEGEYLRGFESWDAVDGALLEFYLHGPLHWLGLADNADDAVRLTAYGRAFLGQAAWSNPTIKPEMVTIQPDGLLLASRKVPTIDRFQLARFTTWQPSETPYLYKLDSVGLQQAATQGITPAHIAAFLKRQLENKPLPPKIAAVLENWQGSSPVEATFERLLIIRTTAPEILDRLYEAPPLRRYLKARLGPMAGVIDAEQSAAFKSALEEMGIKVEVL